jgi:hypothetical protein
MKRTVITLLLPFLLACRESPDPPKPAPGPDILRPGQNTCKKCGAVAGMSHVCGQSRFCDSCLRDVFQNHVCTKTHPCLECAREVGEDHGCGYTKICWRPTCTRPGRVIEGGTGHVCGKTIVCHECKVDAGMDDVHDCTARTYFCPRCEVEAQSKSHLCLKSLFCPHCRQERSKKNHECYRTRFCPKCGKDGPMRHSHGKLDRSDTPGED